MSLLQRNNGSSCVTRKYNNRKNKRLRFNLQLTRCDSCYDLWSSQRERERVPSHVGVGEGWSGQRFKRRLIFLLLQCTLRRLFWKSSHFWEQREIPLFHSSFLCPILFLFKRMNEFLLFFFILIWNLNLCYCSFVQFFSVGRKTMEINYWFFVFFWCVLEINNGAILGDGDVAWVVQEDLGLPPLITLCRKHQRLMAFRILRVLEPGNYFYFLHDLWSSKNIIYSLFF